MLCKPAIGKVTMNLLNKKSLIVFLVPSDFTGFGLYFIQYLLIVKGWSEWSGVFTKFIPVGVCLIAVMQWRAFRRKSQDRVATELEIKCYCLLPLRTVSRCWGWMADVKLPEVLRPYVYSMYINMFKVNLSEALNEDLKSYSSLADFFSRQIKQDVRKIDQDSCLVSPCDGTVLHLGPVHHNEDIEQVKGITYKLPSFFGENTWNSRREQSRDYRSSLLHNKKDCPQLYQCVIYLAPGDYHRFHSPANWKPTHRRHFHGELLSVNPKIAKWIPGLFSINERSIYLGEWEHGFFSYTAVGATNVGTIKVYFDKNLQTNCSTKTPKCRDVCFGNSLELKKGDIVGEFRMGSTIVLVFQAPPDFQFTVNPGTKIKMGQSLGCVEQRKQVDKTKPQWRTL
ncbi:phosphatidylserine decarboxylase proenzyme, mitochondrial isoform X2 [Harmonia axyridis]|uniref:phosphatidylserine decarboxylase proenzyme, mitochondrial isoform X2 n=1 Tax=Harmonia axyridis TaxID=115357 RepID=UPI001E276F2C|nr:phosphatidylserine decarboxylase proenzyme, mitochondrial isoform X2 [Harmonia axyridis]